MTYLSFKHLLTGLLTGDNTLPPTDEVLDVLVEYALYTVSMEAEPLQLMTLDLTLPMVRLGPGNYIVRKSTFPTSDMEHVDIDDGLLYAVVRLVAATLSRENGGLHTSIANKIMLEHNAKVYETIEQFAVEEYNLDDVDRSTELGCDEVGDTTFNVCTDGG